ncbi:MAG: enolase C-terminal domain-like protein [Adhaeribacter sp.]
MQQQYKPIRVVHTHSDFEREKLIRPFGFKGAYLTELWQVASLLVPTSGLGQVGLATQSVLYGDAYLFARHSEAEGNAMMYLLAGRAGAQVRECPFTDPIDLLAQVLPALRQEGRRLTGKADLHSNFLYNALVSVDHAAWLLYAAENKLDSFDAMIPAAYRPALGHRNGQVAVMFQVPYGMPLEEIRQAADQGYFVFKIKTGYPGSQQTMLEQDMERLSQIHQVLGQLRSDQTPSGRLLYTMDANARYEKKETLLRYLDHARKIGAFDHILFYEEPLVESNEEEVGDAGLPIAADESAHDVEAARCRLEQGYGALVLKGIAKTLSLSLQIAQLAHERHIPCLCSDLTVNPILVDWHKNLASRLAPFPALSMGLLETNGDMNYRNWEAMMGYHPAAGASWVRARQGAFHLDEDFYRQSGGILESPAHYRQLLQAPVC